MRVGLALAHACFPAVLRAGALIMQHYRGVARADAKQDGSPVTRTDREAEKIIVDFLRGFMPPVLILSEEAAAAGRIPPVRRRFWLIDALDGTREFLVRNGEFTVNLALVDSGRPLFGIVYAPATGRLFAGMGAGRAYEWAVTEGQLGKPRHLRGRAKGKQVMVMSRSHAQRGEAEMAKRYGAKKVLIAGSSLKFCLLAAGEADIYPREGPTMIWDTAAGHAVLSSAGGHIELLSGGALTYGPYDGKSVGLEPFRNPPFLALAR